MAPGAENATARRGRAPNASRITFRGAVLSAVLLAHAAEAGQPGLRCSERPLEHSTDVLGLDAGPDDVAAMHVELLQRGLPVVSRHGAGGTSGVLGTRGESLRANETAATAMSKAARDAAMPNEADDGTEENLTSSRIDAGSVMDVALSGTMKSQPTAPEPAATPAGAAAAARPAQTRMPVQSLVFESEVYSLREAAHGGSFMQQTAIPLVALACGSLLVLLGQTTVGLLAVYFGAQSGFSLYMKVIMSTTVISEELQGFPAAFLVTAIQQVVAFAVLLTLIAASGYTRWRYSPQRLQTVGEWSALLLFSLAFALNIGLNNFSLSLMAVSMNLIVRSCLPLVTLGLQVLVHRVGAMGPTASAPNVKPAEVAMMTAGVLCAGLATVAEREGTSKTETADAQYLLLGVFMCGLSDVAAALNLVLASMWKRKEGDTPSSGAGAGGMTLGPLDMTFYMSVPAAIFLSPAIMYWDHPVEWPGYNQVTDWNILWTVLQRKPTALVPVVLSGVLAAAYNILQYRLVQYLSATHAAFAGNFNKAATIMLSICMGLEKLPGAGWGTLMLCAVVGNILSFTGYSILKVSADKPLGKEVAK